MKKFWIGFFLLVILTSSVYILLPDNVRIDIEKTKTTFQVWENENWVLAGTERTILFDGTKKMRANSRTVESFVVGNQTKVVRTAYFKDNITAIDTYYFDGSTKNVELYPVEHTVEILNGMGKLFVYEVNDLEYSSITLNNIQSPQRYGHKMKVEWGDGNYYSKIFKYKNKDVGKLTIKYRIDEHYKKYSVRLFDPEFDWTTGLRGYYSFDDASGTNVKENVTAVYNLTISGSPTWIGGILGGGLNFSNGIYQDNASVANAYYVNNSDFSISVWYNMYRPASAEVIGALFSARGSTPNFNFGLIAHPAPYNVLSWKNTPDDTLYTSPVFDNTWHHLVITRVNASGNYTFYYDGLINGTLSNNDTELPHNNFWVGGTYQDGAAGGIFGTIDELGIWNRTLTNQDVLVLYNSGIGCAYGDTECESPDVVLNYPENNFNTTDLIEFNSTNNPRGGGSVVNVSLYLDGVLNETNSSGDSGIYIFSKILSEDSHNWSILTFNDVGSTQSETRNLTVYPVNPELIIDYPSNTSYSINVSELNYNFYRINLSSCWYSRDDGTTNSSLELTNFTDVFSVDGSNTWIVFCNDTSDNQNQSSVTFFKDVTIPLIEFESETDANATIKNQSFVYANVSVTETNEQNITFELYWQNGTLVNSTFSTLTIRERNWTGLDYGIYLYNVTVFDVAGNSNSTETRTIYLSNIFLFIDNINVNNLHIELNTTVNLTGNSSVDFGLLCLDIDHPEYGDNYTCSSGSVTTNLTFNYFRKTTFWNGTTTWNFSDFNLTGDTYFTNETLNFTAHQYDEIDDLRFNISSTDSASDIIFYSCNTTSFDRFYKGALVDSNIYLNQSVDSSGAVFYNWSNVTFDNPGNATVYFAIDDNATIINISMNATGIDYGFSYFDEFTNFSNIDISETTAQLHYGPGGFIQTPNSSLVLNTLDTFSDASINGANWAYGSTESGSWGDAGVRETGGYLEAYGTVNNGYFASISKAFYPWANFTWYYTSDSLSFDLDSYSYELEDDAGENDCHESNRVLFGNVAAWQEVGAPGGKGESTNVADMGMNFIKINNTHWMLNISGTQVRTNGAQKVDCDDTGASVYTFDYSNGLYSINYTDTDCTDIIIPLSNSSLVQVDEDYVIIQVFDTFVVDATGKCYGNSYIRMDNLKNTMWNRTNGTVTSNSVFDSSANIITSTMNISGYNGINYGNYSFSLFMSADNGAHWEGVTNGVEHTFNYPGTHMKWRIDFNTTTPGYQNITSYVENVTIETPVSNISDVEFDFGNDGTWDYKINGTLGSANDTIVISMPNADISNAFSDRRTLFSHMYQVPMRIYSASSGQLNLNTFNITYNPNPVILNYTAIQYFLDDYGSNETNFTIPIAGASGTVNVSDIKLDYAGGNSTIAITARNILNTLNITKYIYPYYSRWDYMFGPVKVDFLEFIPNSPTSLNVTPYGQTNSTPILNLTNYGYGDKNANLSVYLNDTSTCVNLTISTTWNKEDGVQLNNSWNELDSATVYLSTNNLSMWADYDCDYQNWTLFNPYLYFRQCCDGCACSTEVD